MMTPDDYKMALDSLRNRFPGFNQKLYDEVIDFIDIYTNIKCIEAKQDAFNQFQKYIHEQHGVLFSDN